MFPDQVGQFVLDGVSDSIEYSQNLWNWGRSAMDHTSKVSFAELLGQDLADLSSMARHWTAS
jgi:hypothetical protein